METDTNTTEYALEGAPIRGRVPGVIYASHPTFPTFCEALRAASYFPRIPLLRRHDGGPWERMAKAVA